MNNRVRVIQRTAAVSAESAAATSNAQELPNALHTQPQSGRLVRGFTLLELIFVIGTLVLAVLIVPELARPKNRNCGRLRCPSNLKQIGLAFRMWANDHENRFPMQVSVAEGGTKELALRGLALPSFATISNELCNPKPLHCPQDFERERTREWAQLAVTNLSYFVSIDASETNSASILAGDRNICIGGQLANGLVQITNSKCVSWGVRIHANQGHITLADGSAHQVTDTLFQKSFEATHLSTNRFAIP